MANVVPYSFAQELLKGTHNFPTNTIYIALYEAGSGAPYTVSSTAYSSGTANQVTVTFDTISWTSATFGAAYGVLYNNSSSDKLIVVLDFGGTKSCSNGTFTITFPSTSSGTPAGSDSLISITS
jgi:hypothetical protein